MDQLVDDVDAPTARASTRTAPPRIYYIDPLLAGPLSAWSADIERAAALGFTHILSAPIFEGPSVLLPDSFELPHRTLAWHGDAVSALRSYADSTRAAGLTPLLDVNPARVGASGKIARELPELFRTPERTNVLDPRAFDVDADAAPACWEHAAEALVAFWTEQMQVWREAGVEGFRILLGDVPPEHLRGLIAGMRASGAGVLLGWTPGVPLEAVERLGSAGLDFTFASLPWWDYHADWLWREAEILRRVAPPIASVEAPFGPRLAGGLADPRLLAAAQARVVRFAAAFGEGWMMPMGFEWGATHPMDPRHARPAQARTDSAVSDVIRAANKEPQRGEIRLMSGPETDVAAFLRSEGDPRFVRQATLNVANLDLERRHTVALPPLIAAIGGRFAGESAEATIVLPPAELRSVSLVAHDVAAKAIPVLGSAARKAAQAPRIGIENVSPSVENGRFPAKRLAGEVVTIEADLICDGHDQLAACVQWRPAAEREWREVRMRPLGNDRWAAPFALRGMGRYVFRIEAWRDAFATFTDELRKKNDARIDVSVELIEGRRLIAEAGAPLAAVARAMSQADQPGEIAILLAADTATLMVAADKRPRATRTDADYAIEADRAEAEFASWYEVFPRSMSDDPARHGTFEDVIRHLPRIRDMGFDVLYFPPIHPIGRTNRKGRNNALKAAPDDPGSPYAIGGEEGGHDAFHPQLGTLEDFQKLRAAAVANELEIALDFAIQCSPDHPWLKQHPKWFAWRPDGSIRYAENPPKKYEDIVNVDFYADAAIPDLWVALAEVVIFWAEQGVRMFRVDNPHTKPFPFWEWMIAEVKARFPDTIFLAEAFTRPKVMDRLGKIGFSQSYTYFTWRNTKQEIEEYLVELSSPRMREFFRPNFFVNTPDINPGFLQTSGRAGFLIRAALAATLSGSWGVYNGFELCEASPLPGREEYLDSEKYQIRAWDWQRPGNIVADIARLNMIRRLNPALHTHLGVSFLPSDNDRVLFYEKAVPDRSNVVFVAVSLDPFATQSSAVELPLYRWGIHDQGRLMATDLVRDTQFTWGGKWQRITLDTTTPFAIWRVRAA
ncbi:MAG TPA: alpha-1,4-glucan--maltose-1-phosphate maltosyltransferase [Acetobacteraceae bacterium]|nr:alpha-1,4-glucan--maltose-1-phosphate maltosyltransferase [Acetobacteraceae bacterium]